MPVDYVSVLPHLRYRTVFFRDRADWKKKELRSGIPVVMCLCVCARVFLLSSNFHFAVALLSTAVNQMM